MAKIDENTVIQFNLKWFIGIIIALLTSFASFYYTVQKPNNDSIKDHMDELMVKEREYQELKFEKLDEVATKLNDVENKVDALQRRELDELRNSVGDNTSASF
jgi:hypothetical protein